MDFTYGTGSKKCAGDGCTAEIPATDSLCAHCAMKAATAEFERELYVRDGLRELEGYLARWAAFEAEYGAD